MELRVIGPGCARCEAALRAARAAAASSGLPVSVVKDEDLSQILIIKTITTPALVLDGVLRSSGRVPDEREILGWILGTSAR